MNQSAERMRIPGERGPRSAAVLGMLHGSTTAPVPAALTTAVAAAPVPADPLRDDDLQLALNVLYELHYRGIEGIDSRWEWNPAALAVRAQLEALFEPALREAAGRVLGEYAGLIGGTRAPDVEVMDILLAMTEPASKPGLSAHAARRADLEQYRELMINRSLYQLKEADPHTFGIPRLTGGAKAALVEIQADEYGGGRPEWVHATMFARSMTALGLSDRYGHYVDQVPAEALAVVNVMSLFGLHRRLRGALVGHLAAFEMTSTLPNRLYAQGLRRLGLGEDATAYFDEHVEADAVHEQIALRDLAGGLVRQDPDLAADVLLGAAAALALDETMSDHVLSSWTQGRTSLREEPAGSAALPV